MAKFTFKLQAVLRHRTAIEQEKQRLYAHALAAFKELEDQLKSLNQSMQTSNDDIRQNRLVGRLDIGFITAHRRFLMGMQRKAMDLVAAMARARQLVDAARINLAEAAKQRKILEKLRETQEQRWREELSRKETIAADEVAMQLTHDAHSAYLNPQSAARLNSPKSIRNPQ
jgi:flagellar FliJ protein